MEGMIFIHNNLHGSQFFNQLVKLITMLGDGGIIWLVIVAILLCFKKTRVCGFVLLISLGVGHFINENIIKLIFTRTRPFNANPEFKDFIYSLNYNLPGSYSFPSGHTASSFNCALILTLFNKKFAFFAYPLATLIGLSRVFMLVHYPTDVLAGAIVGTLVALMMFCIYKSILRLIQAYKRGKVRAKHD